jgi:hypothetical protein
VLLAVKAREPAFTLHLFDISATHGHEVRTGAQLTLRSDRCIGQTQRTKRLT